MKSKELISLRRKPLEGGGYSLYLDYSVDGIRRKEYLKMYLVPGKTKVDKGLNEQTLAAAETIRAKKIIALQKGMAGIPIVTGKDMYLSDYIRTQEADYRDRGHDEYANTLMKLAKWINRYGKNVSLRQVDRDYLSGFIKYLGKNLAPSTTKVYFSNLNTVLNRAYRSDIIAINPITKLDPQIKPKTPDTQREYLTLDELKVLIETPCKKELVKKAFLFSCFTGLRLSDIEKLTWGDIRMTASGWCVEERQKKTKRMVVIPLSANALSQLPDRGDSSELVWGALPCRVQIAIHIKKWMKDAGIEKKITFHCSRHTFATLSLTYGADIYTIKTLMGHKDIATTQVYATVIQDKKVEAVNLIPSL